MVLAKSSRQIYIYIYIYIYILYIYVYIYIYIYIYIYMPKASTAVPLISVNELISLITY